MLGNMVSTVGAAGGGGFADEQFEKVAKNGAANHTYTADTFVNKRVVFRDCNGANRTDTTPTATQIVNTIPNCVAGASFIIHFRNNTLSGSYTLTLNKGTGVFIWGDKEIATGKHRSFLVVVNSVSSPDVEMFALTDD